MDTYIRELIDEMKRVHHLHMKVGAQYMSTSAISKDQAILLYFIKKGKMSQKEIAKELHIRESTLSVRLDRLEKAGLITREADSIDKRTHTIKLTEEGHEKLEQGLNLVKRFQSETYKNLTKEDYEHLMHILHVIGDNLERMEE